MRFWKRFKDWFGRRTRREKALLTIAFVLTDVWGLSLMYRAVTVSTLTRPLGATLDRAMSDERYYPAACRLADHFAAERPPAGTTDEGLAGLTPKGDVAVDWEPGQMPLYYRVVARRWLGASYVQVVVCNAIIEDEKYSIATRFYPNEQ